MAVLLYLWAYSLTSLAAFGVVAAVEHVGARTVRIEDLEGLFRTRPWGAMSLSVCLLSLLGFPGTFGFIGKWLIMTAALDRGQVILPVLVGLGSLVSLGYYLPVIMAMTMKPERSPEAHRQVLFSQAGKLVIAGSVALIILMGLWPRIPLQLGRNTVQGMTNQKVVASEQP
jgi:NADH-quinone oxidoreductase subunit N